MEKDSVTKVRFDLWAVLGFLVLLVGVCVGYLFNAQATNREERQVAIQIVSDRVTRLEANYSFIIEGITDLKRGQKELEVAIVLHEKSSRKRGE